MCNISGYVGTKQAAPILIEMIKRQEGFAGGYYTGIATIHDGKIYYAKLTGDIQRLTELTNAADLPGTIGIIHSRSDSGGGDGWAHPFIGSKNGKEITAYVANGGSGIFTERNPEYGILAQKLAAEGYCMQPGEKMEEDLYPILSDGTRVHMSDVMCQLITGNIVSGMSAAGAMECAFCEMPGEIVGLLLSLTEPDCIIWSRINRPMMLGFSSHGAYLSTTAMAFPTDAGEPMSLPTCSSGCVFKDRVTMVPYKQSPTVVEEADFYINEQAYEKLCAELKDNSLTFPAIEKIIKSLYGAGKCIQNGLIGYEILRSLKKQGKLELETCYVSGAREGIKAPEIRMMLK